MWSSANLFGGVYLFQALAFPFFATANKGKRRDTNKKEPLKTERSADSTQSNGILVVCIVGVVFACGYEKILVYFLLEI